MSVSGVQAEACGPEGMVERKRETYISRTHDSADLLHGVQIRAQTTVHRKDLLVDDSGDRKAIEAVGECLPQLDVISALALVVETVDAVDRGAFMVTSEDEEVLGVLDLVGQEQADGLERLLAAVDVVAQEEVVRLGREPAILKKSKEIVILAMDITANLRGVTSASVPHSHVSGRLGSPYLDGSLQLEENRLRDEDLASLGTEVTDLGLEKLYLLARPAAPHFQKAVNYRVEIDFVLVRHCDDPRQPKRWRTRVTESR